MDYTDILCLKARPQDFESPPIKLEEMGINLHRFLYGLQNVPLS